MINSPEFNEESRKREEKRKRAEERRLAREAKREAEREERRRNPKSPIDAYYERMPWNAVPLVGGNPNSVAPGRTINLTSLSSTASPIATTGLLSYPTAARLMCAGWVI